MICKKKIVEILKKYLILEYHISLKNMILIKLIIILVKKYLRCLNRNKKKRGILTFSIDNNKFSILMLKIKKSAFKTGYNNKSNKPGYSIMTDKKRFRNNLVSSFIRKLKYKKRKSFERKR